MSNWITRMRMRVYDALRMGWDATYVLGKSVYVPRYADVYAVTCLLSYPFCRSGKGERGFAIRNLNCLSCFLLSLFFFS